MTDASPIDMGPSIPTPKQARDAWLAGRVAALRAFVCERMRNGTPPYRLNVDDYPEEARQIVAGECEARGWRVEFEDFKRTTLRGMTVPEYTVRIMKVWQP